ncbi:MAG: MoaD/ThiS family protein [Acidobacteriota bacterium]
MTVTCEFYGVARRRAGTDRLRVEGRTLGEALAALETRLPALSGTVLVGGQLTRHFRLSLNGRQFINDPDQRLADNDVLVLISAASGG